MSSFHASTNTNAGRTRLLDKTPEIRGSFGLSIWLG
jgi:hypothetical protein